MVVNKRELAPLLGCTIPTLDRWLRLWPDFPVLERGRCGRLWRFDAEAARAFVQAKRNAEREVKDQRSAALSQLALPLLDDGDPMGAGAGPSPGERLTMARLRRIEREEAVANGRLVDAKRVAEVLGDVFGRLGRGLRSGLRQIMTAHEIPPDTAAAVEAAFAAEQRQAVARLTAELGDAAAPGAEGSRPPGRPELRLVAS